MDKMDTKLKRFVITQIYFNNILYNYESFFMQHYGNVYSFGSE